MIFGMLNPEKILREMLQICPPRPSHVDTLPWEIQKKSFFSFSCTLQIIYVISEENKLWSTCLPHLKMSPHWLLKCKTFSSDWRFFAFFQTLGSQLWVVVGGSEKNRLWCVATGMSGKQSHSMCSEWPPSALIHASSLSWYRSVA